MSTLLNVAKTYRDAGLSVIGSSKKGSVIEWKEFQGRFPTDEELEYMFIRKGFKMFAIVCGQASGNLEVIDVDTKNDKTGKLWHLLWDKIMDYFKNEPPLCMVETPSGGIHLYYRCEIIEGNLILARRLEDGKKITLIETRGQGGLVMAPPTIGYTSKDSRVPDNIPVLSIDQRDDLLSICRSFNEVFEEEKPIHTRTAITYKLTPWNDYNSADHWKEILTKAGWVYTGHNNTWDYWRRPDKDEGHSASWNREKRQFYVFSSSTGFETNKGYRPFDIYKIIVNNGDVRKSITEIKAIGYGQSFSSGEETFILKCTDEFNKGLSFEDIKDMLSLDFEVAFRNTKDVSIDQLIDAAQSRIEASSEVFWVQDDKGNLHLDKAALGDFLERKGYRLLVENEHAGSFRIIRIDYLLHHVYPVPMDVFRKELESWAKVDGANTNNVSLKKLRNLIRGLSKETILSTIDFLPRLGFSEIHFLKKAGDEDVQWFAFKNTALRVTKTDYEPVKYEDLPPQMLVWKKDILPFNYEVADIEMEEEFNRSPVWKFFKRIAGIGPEIEHLDHQAELPKLHPDLSQRFFAIITSIGYLLSAYKDENEQIAPIFEEDTESSTKGGGTGKGLIFKIIGTVRTVANIDCKLWDIGAQFPFSDVTLDTDIIHFEDVEPDFKVSKLNNVITRGVTINNKYEKSFQIPYENSPKCAITSNFKVKDDSDFEGRRQKKIYLSRYFNKNYKPKVELGMLFGKEWTDKDYQLCFNIVFYCLQAYMVNGIIEFPVTLNVNRKYIEEEFKEAFLKFMDSYVEENKGVWIKVHEAREEFFDRMKEKDRYWSVQKFKKGMTAYAERLGFEFNVIENNNRNIGDRHKEYFIFEVKGTELKPFEAKFLKGYTF